ncbi:MAG: glycosyltransferase family 2 protein [Chloroflexi bacterium]|nr:glycosyltransferase family 2 protein [Chloroflexota bacterium]
MVAETNESLPSPTQTVFIVVAAYNEGRVIAETLAPLIAQHFKVIVVDDGSTDDSWNILKRLPVYSLRHPINLGQGAALQTGAEFALKQGARYIVHFDADGQHNPHDIPNLLAPLIEGSADIVLGSRFLRAADANEIPWQRRLLLSAAVWFNWLFTGLHLSDAHNGFRAFTAEAAKSLVIHENRSAHASEILTIIKRCGLRFAECPTTVRYTTYSRTKGQRGITAFDIVFDLVMRRFLQ